MKHKYTPEQEAFIRKVAPGRYNSEIAELFNKRFGTNLTAGQIRSFKQNHGIQSGVPRRRITDDEGLFTKDQKDFIVRNVKGRHNHELAALVNEKFGLSVTAKQIKTWKKNHGYISGLKGSEGMSPPNKGKPKTWAGGEATRFKKGHIPKNYRPVGSERVNVDGYVEIKVADPNVWKLKHRVIWEEANGPIPKSQVLIFLDQNKQNITLENLALVPQSKLSTLNKKGLLYKNAELTKTGLILADIHQKISERRRRSRK